MVSSSSCLELDCHGQTRSSDVGPVVPARSAAAATTRRCSARRGRRTGRCPVRARSGAAQARRRTSAGVSVSQSAFPGRTARRHGGALVVRRGDPRRWCRRSRARSAPSSVHVSADFGPYGRAATKRSESALGGCAAGADRLALRRRTRARPEVRRQPVQGLHAVLPCLVRTGLARTAAACGRHVAGRCGDRRDSRRPRTATRSRAARSWGRRALAERGSATASHGLKQYAVVRDRPDLDQTSHISPYLKWGATPPAHAARRPRARRRDVSARSSRGVSSMRTSCTTGQQAPASTSSLR